MLLWEVLEKVFFGSIRPESEGVADGEVEAEAMSNQKERSGTIGTGRNHYFHKEKQLYTETPRKSTVSC